MLDCGEPASNDWLAVNQFTVAENKHERRPDIVLFVNGLPLAVIELKNPADENATIRSAFSFSPDHSRRVLTDHRQGVIGSRIGRHKRLDYAVDR